MSFFLIAPNRLPCIKHTPSPFAKSIFHMAPFLYLLCGFPRLHNLQVLRTCSYALPHGRLHKIFIYSYISFILLPSLYPVKDIAISNQRAKRRFLSYPGAKPAMRIVSCLKPHKNSLIMYIIQSYIYFLHKN